VLFNEKSRNPKLIIRDKWGSGAEPPAARG